MTKQGPHGIAWTDYSWPIVNGCRRVSEGCRNCYAERLAATRLAHTPKYEGLARMTSTGPQWTGTTRLWEPELEAPLKLRKPSRIFVADMGDLFYEGVSFKDIYRVFMAMWAAPQHQFQVLTKRPARMKEAVTVWLDMDKKLMKAFAPDALPGGRGIQRIHEPLANVWFGVSVENQATADERIPLLLQTPAAVRFVSYEPALSAVDFEPYVQGWIEVTGSAHHPNCDGNCIECPIPVQEQEQIPKLDWIIVGGESGPNARPFDLAWARQAVEQCRAAGVACFVKQLGAHTIGSEQSVPTWVSQLDSNGGNWECWPEDLRVRQWPEARA